MNFRKKLKVAPGSKVTLKDWDPEEKLAFEKESSRELVQANIQKMKELQYTLYAENKRSILIVLQGMDAAGKDGTIRHVMSGMNPQGCKVTPFKKPSSTELDHDYLWRIHKAVPAKGEIGIFNRSHYEDVLVVRVHDIVPKAVWSERYEEINQFEKYLTETGTTVLKFFLYISKEEQRERLQERLDNPDKNWKFTSADVKERKFWPDYFKAFEDTLEKCSTGHAPWYVIPSNRKWFRNLAVSEILVETMEDMKLTMPKPTEDLSNIVIE